MKKFIFLVILSFLPILGCCQSTWIEVQSVVVPNNTPLHHYYTEKGTIKYVLFIGKMTVPVSKTNAEQYLNGTCVLEVVKWYSKVTSKYKYTTRKYNSSTKDIDLQTIFNDIAVKPTTIFKPYENTIDHYSEDD